jgi:hypothetical protein
MKTVLVVLVTAGFVVSLCGCAKYMKRDVVSTAPVVAMYSGQAVVVDGKLDDPVWKSAPVYKMGLSRDKIEAGKQLQEGGAVRFAWDDKYFYVAMDFTDSDIVAEGKTDQLMHYEKGDVGELFLKPDDYTWYWEMYVTPTGKKTNIWFPGRGRLLVPSCLEYTCGLTVAAQCDGTLNRWQDTDKGWTAEMAMPISDLTARGESFGPGSKWHVFVGRYNYSRYLNTIGPELSSSPQLSATNYHLLEEYAPLVFQK